MVTRIETASLPPARRVHTDAEASVQGVAPATISPAAKLGESNWEANQAMGGIAPRLIKDANPGASGRRTDFHIALASRGRAIKKSTVATMAFRIAFQPERLCASGAACSTSPKMIAASNAIRNQRRARKLIKRCPQVERGRIAKGHHSGEIQSTSNAQQRTAGEAGPAKSALSGFCGPN